MLVERTLGVRGSIYLACTMPVSDLLGTCEVHSMTLYLTTSRTLHCLVIEVHKAETGLVYRARPISLAYWKLELGHREKRERV